MIASAMFFVHQGNGENSFLVKWTKTITESLLDCTFYFQHSFCSLSQLNRDEKFCKEKVKKTVFTFSVQIRPCLVLAIKTKWWQLTQQFSTFSTQVIVSYAYVTKYAYCPCQFKCWRSIVNWFELWANKWADWDEKMCS